MKREKKDKNFLDKPYYEGGTKAMRTFVDKHLKYPKEAAQHKTTGTVVIRYTIDHKGKVVETKVLSGIGHGCDEEAQRVVRLFKFQVGKYRNMKVQFHKTIKIHFHGKKTTAPAPQKPKPVVQGNRSLTYTVTKSKAKEKKNPEPKKGGGYSYTVKIT